MQAMPKETGAVTRSLPMGLSRGRGDVAGALLIFSDRSFLLLCAWRLSQNVAYTLYVVTKR
jgi:hypothetical protein